ncbi:LOW QUALITY PROTEIN: histidine triad nucleotide-binding protein 1-like [Phasianus colchicus]|uniref:LOW QUALITY PROTEIN: histidine triad nucleotide-binding protein 1-like n=1 Tax=Phasianus colchicus TaxID=9054 RepID=UPI00129EF243|nr:LOW QUALITY PROTEIN: histidine triad nucleotide-binding protein 1-like [Phasianus colchicus]
MTGGIVRSPAAWRGGAALFGKVARHAFSPDVIREEEPLWTWSALRSIIFHRELLRFFLAAREKAVVRLSEAEDSGAPLHRRLKIVGEKCAAHLGLTDGFRMAVRYPPSGPSDYRTRLLILGGRQLGQPPG